MRAGSPKLFGTLTGVFVPTLLTILGVIMYLRLGWAVGQDDAPLLNLSGPFMVC